MSPEDQALAVKCVAAAWRALRDVGIDDPTPTQQVGVAVHLWLALGKRDFDGDVMRSAFCWARQITGADNGREH